MNRQIVRGMAVDLALDACPYAPGGGPPAVQSASRFNPPAQSRSRLRSGIGLQLPGIHFLDDEGAEKDVGHHHRGLAGTE